MQFARAFLVDHKPQVPTEGRRRGERARRLARMLGMPASRGASDGLGQRLRHGHRLYGRLLPRDCSEPHGVRGAHAGAFAGPGAQSKAGARARLRSRVRPRAAGRGKSRRCLRGIRFQSRARRACAHARGGRGALQCSGDETSFEDAAAREAANDVDVIALHGIFSWVARATQDAIVSVLRQRLQPNGLAYVSYNCMPGWAPLAPIRQLMVR